MTTFNQKWMKGITGASWAYPKPKVLRRVKAHGAACLVSIRAHYRKNLDQAKKRIIEAEVTVNELKALDAKKRASQLLTLRQVILFVTEGAEP